MWWRHQKIFKSRLKITYFPKYSFLKQMLVSAFKGKLLLFRLKAKFVHSLARGNHICHAYKSGHISPCKLTICLH